MKKWTCCLSVFALFLGSAAFAAEKKVEVESPYKYVKDSKGSVQIKSRPYLERRPNWGIRLNFATSEIALAEEPMGEKDGAPFQVDISINKNFGLFSLGPEFGVGTAKFENTASFTALSLGLGFYLNGVTKTSFVVPFASVGLMSLSGSVDQLNEDGSTASVDIDTEDIIPYYRAGVLIGLNWIDKGNSLRALSEYGLQNSFLYFAMRKITSTTKDETLFDLETEFYLEYGLQLEF